jgi:hypothetical protein
MAGVTTGMSPAAKMRTTSTGMSAAAMLGERWRHGSEHQPQ